ncbi:MAG: acyltransferase family protein [Eubacteriales bacterium]|nr:acyltransferase family protein [Eubacteriales bacterium]
MSNAAGNDRVALWDNYKFILIYLVVLGHLANKTADSVIGARAVFLFIYLFHMPAFAFVSGLFAKNTVKNKRYDKVFEYLTLYLGFSVLMCLFYMVIQHKQNFRLLYQDSTPWYALALFNWFLITICLQRLKGSYWLIASIVLGIMVGYDKEVHDVLALSRTLVLYPFFLTGYLLDRKKLEKLAENKVLKILSIFALAVAAGLVYWKNGVFYHYRGLYTARNGYALIKAIGNSMYGGVYRMVYYVVAAGLSFLLLLATPTRRYFFTSWGTRSMTTYVFHMIPLYLFTRANTINGKSIAEYMIVNSKTPWIFVIAAVIVFVCGMPVFEKILNFFVKPRWKSPETETKEK